MKRNILITLIALAVLAVFAAPAAAQDSRAELKARFKQRHAEIAKLREAGKAGETWHGQIEAIDEALVNKDEKKLLQEENGDRKKLYDLIAAEVVPGEAKVPAAVVAQRNAKRNFENAKSAEYLKVSEGRWIQKKNEARYEKLVRLKREGKVGETASGYVEAVRPEFANDAEIKPLLADENRDRRQLYERIAKASESSADAVAQAAGREILKHTAPGEYYKPAAGNWVKKPAPRS